MMKTNIIATSVVAFAAGVGLAMAQPSIALAKPSPKQIKFADWEIGAFIHYGLNVYSGQEHGDGKPPPSMFNPTELDTEQWVLAAKALGANYACLTARHEGGFCLWPSKTTDYTIANSPYKDGKGDIVREFVDACRKHDIAPALYHTCSHDTNAALSGYEGEIPWGPQRDVLTQAAFKDPQLKERYKQVQLGQMRELLTNYGPIAFMWSDHWGAPGSEFVWVPMTDLVAKLQPDMVFMGPETWVPGNETGHVVYPMWNAVQTTDGTNYSRPAPAEGDSTTTNKYGLLEGDVRAGHPFGRFWRVRECTTNTGFAHGGWFWHPGRTRPRTLDEHINLYYRTVGLGANTIINLPPDNRGLIPDDIVAAAKAFGDEIRKRFSNPVAELDSPAPGDTVELSWDKPAEIDTIVTMENIAKGQKVAKYTLEAFVDGKWQALEPNNSLTARKPYNSNPGYETIGHKKIDRIVPVTTNRIRFRCLKSVAKPVELRRFSVFQCQPKRHLPASYPWLSGVETLAESAHQGVKRSTNYTGGTISINGRKFEHGLMACPAEGNRKGIVEFALSGVPKAKGLLAVVGIDDLAGPKGSCIFIVEGRKGGDWIELTKSPRLTGKDDGIELDLVFPPGLDRIRLTTTDGGDEINSDHAVWAGAKFTE